MKKQRGRCTPYAFFLNVCRGKCAKKIAAKVEFKTLSRICWEKWQTMTEYQKTRFVQMSKYDEVRFEKEMEDYNEKKRMAREHKRSIQKKRQTVTNKSLFNNSKIRISFSAEEDAKLLKCLGPDGIIVNEDITRLSNELNRGWGTIQARMKKLQRGSSKREIKFFTMKEDMLIIDKMIVLLLDGKLLHEATVTDSEFIQLGQLLQRSRMSIRNRWTYLKTWLLCYYNKTLNLDIRPMLVNVLADNFESEDAVDWDFVLKFPEFSGHSTQSLRHMLHNYFQVVSKNMKISRIDLTLKQVSKYIKENYKPQKLTKRVEKRQGVIIEYFEKMVNSKGITNFVKK